MPISIPLFPLGTVLFPGLLLPLHVFEERYRMLVQHLVALPADRPRRFGVVAIREGREVGAGAATALYDVGCTADLKALERYPDGRFDIVTTGGERFRVLEVDESLPYLSATVEILPDTGGTDADVLAPGVGRLFRSYRDALLDLRGEEVPEPPPLPPDATVLSYLVAAAMVLDLADKQELLAAPDTAARLARELALLRREAAVLKRLRSLPAVELTRTPVVPN